MFISLWHLYWRAVNNSFIKPLTKEFSFKGRVDSALNLIEGDFDWNYINVGHSLP